MSEIQTVTAWVRFKSWQQQVILFVVFISRAAAGSSFLFSGFQVVSAMKVARVTHHHQLQSLRMCKLLLPPPGLSNHVSLCLQSFIYVCIKLLKGYLDKTRFQDSVEGSHCLCNFDFKINESPRNRKFHISDYFKINTVQV